MDRVVTELFDSLESNNPQKAEEAKKRFHEHFNSTKESWLVHGIFEYYIQTGSLRSVDILVGVREPHERYLFDRVSDSLRSSQKLQALNLLGHVVRRNPSWLYKIIQHQLIKELLRLLKVEKDVLSLMSALLIIIILLPIIAGLLGPHLPELFEIFSHLAAWNTNNPNKIPDCQLLHLQIGLYAFFNRLYGMWPCNFLHYLRQQYSTKENMPIFSHTIKPMLETVKVHPLLVTASRDTETAPARWKKMEPNDVIMECAKFSVESNCSDKSKEDCFFRSRAASFRTRPSLEWPKALESNRRDVGNNGVPVVSVFSSNLPESGEAWSPTVFTSSVVTETAPTPITPSQGYIISSTYSSQEGNSPPEAAIEATPESTPVKDLRQPLRSSSTVRSLNSTQFGVQSQPSSPMKKEQSPFRFPLASTPTPSQESSSNYSKDIKRVPKAVLLERDRLFMQQEKESLKPKTPLPGHNYQPSSPLRVISTPLPFDRSALNSPHMPERSDEDREVETTMRTDSFGTIQIRRNDSVLNDVGNEDEEFEECVEAGELGGCIDGGIHMPDSRSIAQFARQVNRLRFHSQCQPDTFQLAHIGISPKDNQDQKVRRASSCPEIKKETNALDFSAPTLEETEEEESPSHTAKEKQKELVTTCTQTDDLQPLVYEHLFLSVFPPNEQIQQHSAPPEVPGHHKFNEPLFFSPRSALEAFIETTVRSNDHKIKSSESDSRSLKQQLELLMHQLQFEKHRREVHAERNRRLLGKSRNNRVLEEHNSALRDQVALLHKEIETLHNELERNKRDAKHNCDQLQKNLNYWQEQTSTLQRNYKDAQGQISLFQKELEEEKKKMAVIAREYTLTQAELFEMKNTLEGATAAATMGREIRGEMALLQHHLTASGELETRLRSTINCLTLRCHKDTEALIASQTYSVSLSNLQSGLKIKDSIIDAEKCKINDAQIILESKEKLSNEKDDLIESIIINYTSQLKESDETCTKLRKLHNSQEERILELNQQIEILEQKCKNLNTIKVPGSQDAVIQSSPPLSNSLSSGTLSVTGGSPQMQNLQLLVDSNEPGSSNSKENSSPL